MPVSTAKAAKAATLDGMTTRTPALGAPSAPALTALAARARRLVGTGGPEEGGAWLEHVLGWTLVAVVAMFVTQVGWL
ncbi:SCO1431 family membrane protein [Streptomyces sp. A1136]|nr:SCO1431 family membrane protein [Streptomyces sp. A1136]